MSLYDGKFADMEVKQSVLSKELLHEQKRVKRLKIGIYSVGIAGIVSTIYFIFH